MHVTVRPKNLLSFPAAEHHFQPRARQARRSPNVPLT
jgi:hypothetical protein